MLDHLADGVLTLTLDRPQQLNALDAVEMNRLADAITGAAGNPTVRVIVLEGQGRAFCSGADISAGADLSALAGPTVDAANALVAAIVNAPQPVVARARGVVAGVGVSIALAADLTVCDDRSFFALVFTNVGLMPDGGATKIVAASIGRAAAMRMSLLGERLTAQDALAAGLISHVLPTDDYDEGFAALVRQLASGPAVALARTKDAINAATLPDLDAVFARERAGQVPLLAAADFAEGTAAFAEKRRPVFTDVFANGTTS